MLEFSDMLINVSFILALDPAKWLAVTSIGSGSHIQSIKKLTMCMVLKPFKKTTDSRTLNVINSFIKRRAHFKFTLPFSALLNVIETLFNLFYVYLAHISQSPVAPLVGFASATMTLAKTILYWAQEYFCGGCAIGHNSMSDLIVYWIIPNG